MGDKSEHPVGKGLGGIPPGGERVLMVMESDAALLARGDAEINLRELWNTLWQGKWVIVGVTAVCAFLSVGYALSAPQWYRAEVVFVPASEKYGGNLSGRLGQLGGLASLAGINVGGNDDSSEALAVLESHGFTRDFIEEQNLLPILFADQWDAESGRWRSDDSTDWPEIRDAIKYFDEDIRSVTTNTRTGVMSLTIEWTDPEMAAQWANLLVERVNERMRQRALTDAETNVAYLQVQMTNATQVTLQQSIGRLLESELEKLMIARGNAEFAFRFVDRATAPKWRSRPRRAQLVLLSVALGGILSLAAVLARAAFRVRPVSGSSAGTTSSSPAL